MPPLNRMWIGTILDSSLPILNALAVCSKTCCFPFTLAETSLSFCPGSYGFSLALKITWWCTAPHFLYLLLQVFAKCQRLRHLKHRFIFFNNSVRWLTSVICLQSMVSWSLLQKEHIFSLTLCLLSGRIAWSLMVTLGCWIGLVLLVFISNDAGSDFSRFDLSSEKFLHVFYGPYVFGHFLATWTVILQGICCIIMRMSIPP